MKKYFLVYCLLVSSCIVPTAYLQAESTTVTTSIRGVVPKFFRAIKAHPIASTLITSGVLLACYLRRDLLLQTFQSSITKIDRFLKRNNQTTHRIQVPKTPAISREDFAALAIEPYQALIDKTEAGRTFSNFLAPQNLSQEEKNKKTRAFFIGETITTTTNGNTETTVNPGLFQHYSPTTCLSFAALLSTYKAENHDTLVTELIEQESSALLEHLLLANHLQASNEIKICILDALAKRLVTKEQVRQQTIRDLLPANQVSPEDQEKYDEVMAILNEKVTYELARPIAFKTITHDKKCHAIVFSNDGKLVATVADGGTVKITHLVDNTTQTLKHKEHVLRAAFSADNKRVITVLRSGTIHTVDLTNRTQKIILDLSNSDGRNIQGALFSPNNEFIALKTFLDNIIIVRLSDGFILKNFHNSNNVSFSADSKLASVDTVGNMVHIINLSDNTAKTINHTDRIRAIVFSLDSKFVATASDDHTAIVTNLTDWTSRTINHTDRVTTVALSSDSSLVASGSEGGVVTVTNVADGTTKTTINHRGTLYQIVFSPDNTFVGTISGNGTGKLTGLSNNLARTIDDGRSIDISMDSKFIVTAGQYPTPKKIMIMKIADGSVQVLNHDFRGFSPDSRFIATSENKTAYIKNLADGSTETINHTQEIQTVEFSNTNDFVATAAADGTVHVLRLKLDTFAPYLDYRIAEEQRMLEQNATIQL